MKIVKKNQALKHHNSDNCFAYEYEMAEKDINGAVIDLSGRYPEKGWVLNEKCKELIYILEGSGTLVTKEKNIELEIGDQVLLEAGEKYYFFGTLKFFTACSPAWYPDQHRYLE